VGGPTASERNLLSGSLQTGLQLSGAGTPENLMHRGNFIGLRPDGATALPKISGGVQIDSGVQASVLSASRIALLAPTTASGDVLVSFAGAAGLPFSVERSRDLQTSTVWSDSLPGTGAVQTLADPAAIAEPRRFYRVRVGF